MLIRPAQPSDAAVWERMRQSLWPSSPGEHAAEIAAFFQGRRTNSAEVLLAFDEESQPIGFVELSIRNYAEGCSSDRVAYSTNSRQLPLRKSGRLTTTSAGKFFGKTAASSVSIRRTFLMSFIIRTTPCCSITRASRLGSCAST